MSEPADPITTCLTALAQGRKILICGNGGSAAMAQHFAAELVVRFQDNRRALPCIALCDPAILTAIANDFSFHQVFSRQVEAYGQAGDVLIALSTSGRSQNVNLAIKAARERHLVVIEAPRVGLTTADRQEHQLRFLHRLAFLIEDAFVTRTAVAD